VTVRLAFQSFANDAGAGVDDVLDFGLHRLRTVSRWVGRLSMKFSKRKNGSHVTDSSTGLAKATEDKIDETSPDDDD
jgi:hypothetical protein